MKNLFFWVQSLDNQSPDLIFQGREKIVNESIGQKIVSEIYQLAGEKIKLSSEVTVRLKYPKFVIEAIPIEKDLASQADPMLSTNTEKKSKPDKPLPEAKGTIPLQQK